MFSNETIRKLREIHMGVMAEQLSAQLEDPQFRNVPFEDRLAMLVDAEWSARKSNRLTGLIKKAGYADTQVSVENIEYIAERHLDREQILRLASCSYIQEARNVIILGATGAGKTFLACSLGVAANRNFYAARYLYSVEAVKTMAKIAESAEKDIDYRSRMKRNENGDREDITTAIAYATCTAATDLNAAAIITVTMSGFTAEAISRFKPRCPIIGCSINERVCRQLNLLWGVNPLKIKQEETADELFDDAVQEAKKAGYVKTGDVVVITAGVPLGIAGKTNMIHVVEVN